MAFNENAKRCTATAKSTGERCHNPAVTGFNVCRLHGAGSPSKGRRGGRPPTHGRYSAEKRKSLQEKIEQYRNEADPADQWEELALLRALLQDYLASVGALKTEDVKVLTDLQNAIRRTLDTINKIESRTALTQAEVEYLQAAMADVLRRYVPEGRRRDAIDDLKRLTLAQTN